MSRLHPTSFVRTPRLILPLLFAGLVWVVLPVYFLNSSRAQDPTTPDVHLVANLVSNVAGNPPASGTADYRSYPNGRRTLIVTVTNVHVNTTALLNVLVGNITVGQIAPDPDGNATLSLDTAANQNVPMIPQGGTIAVKNATATLLAGIFQAANGGTPTPTPTGTPAVHLFAVLLSPTANSPNAAARGSAEYYFGPANSTTLPVRMLKVDFTGVNAPNGTVLDVAIANVVVAQMTVNQGAGHLDLRDNLAPTVHNGESIQLRNSNAPVLAGVFTPNPPPPPPPPHNTLFSARLNGQQVVPAVQTNGTGFGHVVLNGAQTQIQVFLGAFNLSSARTGASISGPALPGANGLVIFQLGPGSPANTGNIPGQSFTVTAAQVADLRAGKWYFNVRTIDHPDGEIRGQIRGANAARVDFDGDGASDISVFRPSTGMWYALQSTDGALLSRGLGSPGDVNVQGDYDGDGMTDLAVFGTTDGTWRVTQSSTGNTVATQWGLGTDIPMVGDYDGDGYNDLAAFRPSSGAWYILRSSDNAMMAYTWGTAGDRPVSGDFDGDGRTDIAVFRPSSGGWYILRSSDLGMTALGWGVTGDQPASGDFDGDGRTEVAVFRPSNGAWYIRSSVNGAFTAYVFGTAGDLAVPGEYDGDSRTDIAVFRPSTGTWYILRSSDGAMSAAQFGVSSDVPTPTAYAP